MSLMFGSFVVQTLGKILVYVYNDLTYVEKYRNGNIEFYNCCINTYDINNQVIEYS